MLRLPAPAPQGPELWLCYAGTNPHWHADTDTHEIVELLKELTLLSRLLGQPSPTWPPPTLLTSQPADHPAEAHVLVDSRTAQTLPLRACPQTIEAECLSPFVPCSLLSLLSCPAWGPAHSDVGLALLRPRLPVRLVAW